MMLTDLTKVSDSVGRSEQWAVHANIECPH